MAIERRAVWTYHFGVIAHIEENMRMIERRGGADTHKLPGTDFDHRHAGIIVKVGNDVVRHGVIEAPRDHSEMSP